MFLVNHPWTSIRPPEFVHAAGQERLSFAIDLLPSTAAILGAKSVADRKPGQSIWLAARISRSSRTVSEEKALQAGGRRQERVLSGFAGVSERMRAISGLCNFGTSLAQSRSGAAEPKLVAD
jgi:hypothetical protein